MKKLPIIVAAITLLIIIGGVFLFSKNSSSTSPTFPPATYEYFWGDGCPHCKNVQSFMDTWDKKDQINISKLEVWYNKSNAKLMQDRIKSCNLTPSQMGVPLLVTPEGKCLIGDTPIIDLFKSL